MSHLLDRLSNRRKPLGLWLLELSELHLLGEVLPGCLEQRLHGLGLRRQIDILG